MDVFILSFASVEVPGQQAMVPPLPSEETASLCLKVPVFKGAPEPLVRRPQLCDEQVWSVLHLCHAEKVLVEDRCVGAPTRLCFLVQELCKMKT